MALYYTGDKLQFFVTRSSAVSLFRCTFYHLVQFICGEEWCSFSFFSRRFWLCFAIDSSISGLVQIIKNKNTKLFYSRKCWGSFFDVPLLCFYIFGKHIFTCASTSPIFVYTLFISSFFVCIFAFVANSYDFCCFPLTGLAADGEMVIRFGLVGCVLF